MDNTLSVEKLSCGVLAGFDRVGRLSMSFIYPEPLVRTELNFDNQKLLSLS
jgi:hypothetical protein